ncbi:MAG: hypothetical protein ABIU96_14260 [Rhodanobacter sp.]
MYYTGDCVPKDTMDAEKQFRMAIAKGDSDALLNLAAVYFNGDNRPSDPVGAYALADAAARAQYPLPNAASTRDRMRKTLDPSQLKAAQALIDAMVHQPPLAVLDARAKRSALIH